MQKYLAKTVTLHNGLEMPIFGLGLYKMTPSEIREIVPEALHIGYRLFDTATYYHNEQALGIELLGHHNKASNNFSSTWVTSKLSPNDHGYEKSMQILQVSVLDMYLIHWPGVSRHSPKDENNCQARAGSWRALEEAYEQGLLRAIGVSNYNVKHLKEMEEYAKVRPMVNQIELHPAWVEEDVIEYCTKMGIIVQAYASFAEGRLLDQNDNPHYDTLRKIADKHAGSTIAQVLLAWAIQHGWAVIPKTKNKTRLKENVVPDELVLDVEEMDLIDGLHKQVSFKVCWNSCDVV